MVRFAKNSQAFSSPHFSLAHRGKAAFAFALAPVLIASILCADPGRGFARSLKVALQADTDFVVVSLKDAQPPAVSPNRSGKSSADAGVIARAKAFPWDKLSPPVAQRARWAMLASYRALLDEAVRSVRARVLRFMAAEPDTIVGMASTYNPYRDGNEGDAQTASGEFYDPAAWTAAIQIGLRGEFGGVRYGRNYRAAYALVEADGKQAIVKINDVGPLKAGRVIDLNERSMRYFDPTLTRGLMRETKVTLLPGEDWTPGPVGGETLLTFVSAR